MSVKEKTNFGENLRALRESRGISQSKLGKAIGISRDSIYRYEMNMSEPTLQSLKNISKYFKISIDSLLNNSQNISTNKSQEEKDNIAINIPFNKRKKQLTAITTKETPEKYNIEIDLKKSKIIVSLRLTNEGDFKNISFEPV